MAALGSAIAAGSSGESVAKKAWTDADFMALPDGYCYELVNGQCVDKGYLGAQQSYRIVLLSSALYRAIAAEMLGIVFSSNTSFKIKNGNRRSPQISFVAKERLQGIEALPVGYLTGAPDLVVEMLSPRTTVEATHERLVDYFDNGTRLAWVIHPSENYLLVYRSAQEPDRLLKSADVLDGEEVVPGFSFPVAELFQKLSF